jgi:small subunit ribosomal protein S3
MGQKTQPFGFRLGITEAHRSRWYAPKALYGELLVEDERIRRFLDKKLNRAENRPSAAVSDIHIERTREELVVVIKTARPGVVIGPKGAEVDRMTEELQLMTGRKVKMQIIEVKNPDLDAKLVAEAVAEQLAKRASFRRTMKRVIDQTMEAGAKGIKVQLSGRLGGAEMARCEKQNAGSIPLSTLRAKIDYGFVEAKTAQGHIGVQVWINQGMYEDETDGADAQEGQAPKKPKRAYKR